MGQKISRSTLIRARLVVQDTCPACEASSFDDGLAVAADLRRYECGAVFSYSGILDEIVASEPCPSVSEDLARIMSNKQPKKRLGLWLYTQAEAAGL